MGRVEAWRVEERFREINIEVQTLESQWSNGEESGGRVCYSISRVAVKHRRRELTLFSDNGDGDEFCVV